MFLYNPVWLLEQNTRTLYRGIRGLRSDKDYRSPFWPMCFMGKNQLSSTKITSLIWSLFCIHTLSFKIMKGTDSALLITARAESLKESNFL